jgi:hypothetical protein
MICFIPGHHIYYPYSSENKKTSRVADSVTQGGVVYLRVYLIKLITSKLRTHDFRDILPGVISAIGRFMIKLIYFHMDKG